MPLETTFAKKISRKCTSKGVCLIFAKKRFERTIIRVCEYIKSFLAKILRNGRLKQPIFCNEFENSGTMVLFRKEQWIMLMIAKYFYLAKLKLFT